MKITTRPFRFALFAIAILGCSSAADDTLAEPSGTLQQAWTIEGGMDSQACTKFGADRMRILLLDTDGNVETTEHAPCSAFEIRLTLRAQTLTGKATLVSTNGASISKSLSLGSFTLRQGETVTQSVDFPTDAMNP